MAIDRWRPFGTLMDRSPFHDIQSEMNRLFDTFLGRPTAAGPETGSRVWMPLLDMYETNDDLILNFELPGVPEKDISLSITGDMLTLKGERRPSASLSGDNCFRGERTYGKFERSIRLPVSVEAERVTATYRDGVLDVRLPKVEAARPKEIKIDIL
jgi:HSP20 family protein